MPAKSARSIGEEDEHDGGRQCKSGPCGKRAEIAGVHQSDRKSDLAAGRAWQELAQRDQIDKGLLVEPAPADYEFFAKIADMGDRAAEAAHAELEENQQHFERRAGGRNASGSLSGRLACRRVCRVGHRKSVGCFTEAHQACSSVISSVAKPLSWHPLHSLPLR